MLKRRIATLVVGGLVLGGGAAALAESSPKDPTLSSSAELGDRKHRGHRGPGPALLGRGIHGEILVPLPDGGFATVVFDKGTVTGVEDGTVTLEREDGETVSIETDAETRYRGVEDLDGVEVGSRAMVVSRDGTAQLVAQGGRHRD